MIKSLVIRLLWFPLTLIAGIFVGFALGWPTNWIASSFFLTVNSAWSGKGGSELDQLLVIIMLWLFYVLISFFIFLMMGMLIGMTVAYLCNYINDSREPTKPNKVIRSIIGLISGSAGCVSYFGMSKIEFLSFKEISLYSIKTNFVSAFGSIQFFWVTIITLLFAVSLSTYDPNWERWIKSPDYEKWAQKKYNLE